MARKVVTTLLARTTCPHCWHSFEPHEVLWISVHGGLLGDPRLGPEQPMRFLPSRFTPRGTALDGRGEECRDLACPNCHLQLPRTFLEIKPWFVSILGTPACGKSYFLAAMLWDLRHTLPRNCALSFSDTDASCNAVLTDYEQRLFQSATPDEYVKLSDLIHKTEEQGVMYQMVLHGDRAVSYPRPFVFTMRPQPEHPQADALDRYARIMCLYDNAGESFLAGKDTAANPVTRHLAQSSILLYLFDPTQHAQFRERLGQKELLAGSSPNARLNRQDLVLVEAANRVRKFTNIPDSAKHDRPLFVVVTKRDLWTKLLPEPAGGLMFVPTRSGPVALNLDRVEAESTAIRGMLREFCPEIVNAAEQFAGNVRYFGVSSLGTTPVKTEDNSGLWAVRPKDLKPLNVSVPILFGMNLRMPGIIPVAKRQPPTGTGKDA
jgi:hypothetical protein